MSRVGKSPISIPPGVEVSVEGGIVTASGPRGEAQQGLGPGISAEVDGGKILLSCSSDSKKMRSAHGLYRSLIANMVEGVLKGYEKRLEIVGVGYRARKEGDNLILQLGFSHPVEFPIPDGLKVEVEKNTKIKVSGTDKQRVGAFAAKIRGVFPPEPYKGKGIRYEGEYVRRKADKTIA